MPKFRLQTVLNERERAEKLRQKAFAEQLQVVKRAEEDLAEAQAQLQESIARLNHDKANQGVTILQLKYHENYRKHLELQISHLQQVWKQQYEDLQLREAKMVEAAQKRRALEILKERAQEKWEQQKAHAEQIEADEFAQNSYLLQQQKEKNP